MEALLKGPTSGGSVMRDGVLDQATAGSTVGGSGGE
jgi:hypothetical protein